MLPDLQRQMAAWLLDPAAGEGEVAARILPNGLTGTARLGIYRNNTFTSLTEALGAVYPVVQRLVGEGFFRAAGRHYIARHPPTGGNLHDFGGELAGFLGRFPPAAGLPYLGDVADLEWAWHRAFHGAAHRPLDLAALARVAPDRHGELTFRLHPTATLLHSPYPVLRIWQVNQPDYPADPAVDLGEGESRLLVIRPALMVEIHPLAPGEYALLRSLADGAPLADACQAALTAQADFDLSAGLGRLVAQGCLVDFARS